MGHIMDWYEGSIRELFYRSCIAGRSFVPQDDRKIEYAMDTNEAMMIYASYPPLKTHKKRSFKNMAWAKFLDSFFVFNVFLLACGIGAA